MALKGWLSLAKICSTDVIGTNCRRGTNRRKQFPAITQGLTEKLLSVERNVLTSVRHWLHYYEHIVTVLYSATLLQIVRRYFYLGSPFCLVCTSIHVRRDRALASCEEMSQFSQNSEEWLVCRCGLSAYIVYSVPFASNFSIIKRVSATEFVPLTLIIPIPIHEFFIVYGDATIFIKTKFSLTSWL